MRCEAAVLVFLDVLGGLQWIEGNLQRNAWVGLGEKVAVARARASASPDIFGSFNRLWAGTRVRSHTVFSEF